MNMYDGRVMNESTPVCGVLSVQPGSMCEEEELAETSSDLKVNQI